MALFNIKLKDLEQGFQSLVGNLGNIIQGPRPQQPTPTPMPTPSVTPGPSVVFKQPTTPSLPSVTAPSVTAPKLPTLQDVSKNLIDQSKITQPIQTPQLTTPSLVQTPAQIVQTVKTTAPTMPVASKPIPQPNAAQQFINERVQGYKEAPAASAFRDLMYVIAPNVGQYIDTQTAINNRMLADKAFREQQQKSLQTAESFAQKIPRANLQVDTGNDVLNTIVNLPLGFAESVLNIPSNVATGSVGYQKAISSYGTEKPQTLVEAAKGTAPLFEGAFTAMTLGTGSALKQGAENIAQQGLKQAIKQGVKEGAITGGLYGGTYGAIQGVQQTPSDATTNEMLKNILVSSATQGAAGSVLGGTLGGLTGAGGFYVNKYKQINAEKPVNQLAKATTPQEVNAILKSNNFELPTTIRENVANQIASTTNKKQISNILKSAANVADAQTAKVVTPTQVSTGIKTGKIAPTEIPLQTAQPTGKIQITNRQKLTPLERDILQLAVGEKQAANITANIESSLFAKVLKKAGYNETVGSSYKAIQDIQSGKYNNTPAGQVIRKAFDNARNDAVNAGFDVGYLENYLPQIWKQNDKKIGQLLSAKGINTKPGFTASRSVPSYEWGIKNGLTPKYKDAAQLYGAYIKQLEDAKANLRFVNNLQETGIATTFKNAPENWKPIDLPGFYLNKQQLYADPRVVNVIDSIYGGNKGLLSKGAQAIATFNSTWQNIVLGGGIPKTPLNFFTFGQMFKETSTGLGGVLGLVKGDTKGLQRFGTYADLIRSFSGNLTNQQQLANQDLLQEMAKRGVFIKFADFVNRPNRFHRWIDEPTFGRFLPLIELRTARSAFNEAIKKGLSKEEAYNVAAQATKAYHGMSNSLYNLRSKDAQNLIGSVFFAPQYRESLINIYGETAKAFVPGQGANKDLNRYMAAGLGITYLIYNEINKQLNDGKNMWQNEPGKEMSLQIPIGQPDERGVRQSVNIPFAPSLLTIPRNIIEGTSALVSGDTAQATRKFTSNLSMPLQVVGQIASNQDYMGRPIVTTEQISLETGKPQDVGLAALGKQIAYAGQQILPPFPKGVSEYLQGKPIGQAIATGLELPVRYGKVTPDVTKSYFQARDKELLNAAQNISQDVVRRYQLRHAKNVGQTPFYASVNKASDMITDTGRLTEDYYLEKRIAMRDGGIYPHDPLFDLPDNQAFVVLKLQQLQGVDRGDASAKQIKMNNPWLQDFYDQRAAYFDKQNLPAQDSILPKYPEPSTALQAKLDQYNTLPKEQKGAFLKANPEVAQFFTESFDYTNQVRRMQGVPEFAKRPQPTPALQKKLDIYNGLTKGTGERSRFLKSNPDVVDFFNQIKIFNESGPFGTGVFAGGGGTNQTMAQILAEVQKSGYSTSKRRTYFPRFYIPAGTKMAKPGGIQPPQGKGRVVIKKPSKIIVRRTKG